MQHSQLWFAKAFVIIFSALIVACSSSQRIVKTYEGETLPDGQLAKLNASEDIEIVEIDGVKQKTYLLDNLSLTYSLLPGKRTIVYRYSSIWSRKKRSDDADEPSVDVIKSDLQQVTMEFKPGGSYSFRFPSPDNKREAAVLAADFSAIVVDNAGIEVAQGIPFIAGAGSTAVAVTGTTLADQGANVVAETGKAPPPAADSNRRRVADSASEIGVQPVESQKTLPVEAGLSRLEAIKVLWSRASADEKKEFLRWAFQ